VASKSHMDTELNQHLVDLVQGWKKNGSVQQEGFDWSPSRANWEKAFPSDRDFIASLPSEIDRKAVRAICDSVKFTIREKFLSVMIWGYGDRGYGPYRVTQMLNQSHAETVLTEVFDICQSGEPKVAYDYLRKNRIRILGPSYSSKLITFWTPREVGAPIYDSYISLWVQAFAAEDFSGVSTTSEVWNSKTYTRYWDWVKQHSDSLKCFADDIELVIFRDAEAKFAKSSSWAGK
jgi:hypothetical protein